MGLSDLETNPHLWGACVWHKYRGGGKEKKNSFSTVSRLLQPYSLLGPNLFLHKARLFTGLLDILYWLQSSSLDRPTGPGLLVFADCCLHWEHPRALPSSLTGQPSCTLTPRQALLALGSERRLGGDALPSPLPGTLQLSPHAHRRCSLHTPAGPPLPSDPRIQQEGIKWAAMENVRGTLKLLLGDPASCLARTGCWKEASFGPEICVALFLHSLWLLHFCRLCARQLRILWTGPQPKPVTPGKLLLSCNSANFITVRSRLYHRKRCTATSRARPQSPQNVAPVASTPHTQSIHTGPQRETGLLGAT